MMKIFFPQLLPGRREASLHLGFQFSNVRLDSRSVVCLLRSNLVSTHSLRDKGTKGQGTKGQRDKETKGQRDKGTIGKRLKKVREKVKKSEKK